MIAYNNTSKLEELITDVENTINMAEAEAKRLQKSTSGLSRKYMGRKDPMANAKDDVEAEKDKEKCKAEFSFKVIFHQTPRRNQPG